jgi:hypothetical protein
MGLAPLEVKEQTSAEAAMAIDTPTKRGGNTRVQLDLAVHRRILDFINEAIEPQDLMYEKAAPPNPEEDHEHEAHEDLPLQRSEGRRKILEPDIAEEITTFRDRDFPLGFRNVNELLKLKAFDLHHLDVLKHHFGNSSYGSWSLFPQRVPRWGPGGYDGVVHAALLQTGRVLFITADETTLLWNPNDTTAATFELPVNQPHETPDAASGYSVLCSGHSFLSDGQLLAVGGGGYGPHAKAIYGYKFDPTSKTWTRTAGSMVHNRWYPTVLTLGDHRLGSSHEVLVVCGHGAGDMEIYDEASDSFREISGDNKTFPSLYPGLHLLPNGRIVYSRTGWASAGPGGGPFVGDDQSAYFVLTAASTGAWTDIAPVGPSMPDRTKGMSVMLLDENNGDPRVLVLGGSDPSNNNSYEILDATSLSPTSNWGPSTPFPDGEHRSLGSAVLLPDGTVFVCGGIQRTNSPCALIDPQTNSWSPMAALPSIRDYHSVALLLPSGQVAMAGWNNTAIEIFNPPYLYRGARPVISSAPASVQRGQTFEIASPDAATITKVVLARPMAVTHQTDTEQKILNLPISPIGFSTFGTIDTSGAVLDRFGVGESFDVLTFAPGNRGYGPDLFYFVRHDQTGFSTFGTIDTSGAVVDRFGVGFNVDALTFADADVGHGPNLFYYLRHDNTGFSTFGTIDTNGAIVDRFGVGQNLDALTFAPGNRGYGPNLFYYLRHDASGFSTFGTIDTSGAIVDRFGVGQNFDALTFAPGNRGYGPNLFYYLRHEVTGYAVDAPDGSAPYSLAQQGHYMLFALNNAGVPSAASWIYLQ